MKPPRGSHHQTMNMPVHTPCGENHEPRLQGAHNFRSLHGLSGADGRKIHGHSLLRSDHLKGLTLIDWATLSSLGLKTICDLRGPNERQRVPTRLPEGLDLRRLNFDIHNDLRGDPALARELAAASSPAGTRTLMIKIYRSFPRVFAQRLREWFDLFQDKHVPVLVHCAAGKDRTGFLVALLLHALGVSHNDIMIDYLRSAPQAGLLDHRIQGLQTLFGEMTGVELNAEAIMPILDVDTVYLQASFDVITEQYGSLNHYLDRVGGLDELAMDRLRNDYLA